MRFIALYQIEHTFIAQGPAHWKTLSGHLDLGYTCTQSFVRYSIISTARAQFQGLASVISYIVALRKFPVDRITSISSPNSVDISPVDCY